jgi:F-type H+-transporting ATPase subunit b
MRGRRWSVFGAAVASATSFAAVGLGPLAWAAEKAAEEHPGIININVTLFLQLINFLIFVAVLYTFLFKPLTAFLAKRAEGIKQSLEQAQRAREEAAKARAEFEAQMAATRREAGALREQVAREVEEERQRLLRASREEAQRLLAQAREQIEADTRRARAALRADAVDLSVAVAEKLVGRALTADDHRRLAEQYIREIGSQN